MKLRFTSNATRQLETIAHYISAENPAAALRVGDRIRETARFLSRFPNLGRRGAEVGTREIIVPGGIPYIVVYRIVVDTVEVLGVYHTAQLRPSQPGHVDDS